MSMINYAHDPQSAMIMGQPCPPADDLETAALAPSMIISAGVSRETSGADDLARRAAAVQRVFAESIKWDDEAMINFDYDQRHLARCLGCRMANINCEC
jgi:hypothetical protein